ncbi:MAG: MCE family protein [Cyanobacteria bacterium REEB67]|nr:MCE family protein [Cyanobacteria bacterium REEB67]
MTEESREEKKESNLIADGSLGVFSTVALVMLVMGGLWLRDNYHMHQPRFINVYFHDIAQLGESANVFEDGVRIGAVDHLSWIGEHRVLARLKITKHKVKMPQGSRFTILNNGIVGAKYVEIIVPERKPGEAELPELANESKVEGEDPVRPELALNNLVLGLSRIDMNKLADNFDADRIRLVRAADQLAMLATKTMPVVDAALPMEKDLKILTREATATSRHLNKILDNPHFSDDLKETMRTAKETAETIKTTMHELDVTLSDKDLRKDLISALETLHKTTGQLEETVEQVQKITADQDLRKDLKDILSRANETMRNVDSMFKSPTYGGDLKNTLTTTRDAINHLDTAAKQINQILGQRAPLLHMVFGRPGYIKSLKGTVKIKDKDKNKDQSGSNPGNSSESDPVKN